MNFKVFLLILLLVAPIFSADLCATPRDLEEDRNIIVQEIHVVEDKVDTMFVNISRTVETFKYEILDTTEKEISKQFSRIIITVIGIFGASICAFLLFMSIIVTRYFKVERKYLHESDKHKSSRKGK